MPPRGRSPILSPQGPSRPRSNNPLRRSVSPRTAKSKSRDPSFEREPPRRNGNHSRSRSRSLSRSRVHSRSQSRSRSRTRSWSPGARRHMSRTFSRSPSPNNNPPRSSKIVIERLTKNVTAAHLREVFGSFGDIQSVDLPMNRAFMTNRGTAYILYYDPADAEAAIAHMHEAQLDGATLNVSIVLPRRAFSRSPPPAHTGRGPGNQRYGHGRPSDSRPSRPSPHSHRSPPRRYGRARHTERHDLYRPRSRSRSWSRRSRSLSSHSRSKSPKKNNLPVESSRRRKRRSPSYSSYDYSSHSNRSRSRSRD